MNRGIVAALGAYLLWGFFPIYWKWMDFAPATELLAHRMIWSALFMGGLLSIRQEWHWLRTKVNRRTLLTFCLTAALVSINWLVYIWAVNNGYIVDASLGYFINPLVNVVFGALFLGETLRHGQLAAILVAAAGVGYMAFAYGVVLWIALTLAVTFALYGLLRKTAVLEATEGLTLETMLMFIPAALFLLSREIGGNGAFGHVTPLQNLLLAATGVVTAVPLILFAYGARRVTLTTLGLLQFLAPTIQFLVGVLIYDEPFTQVRMIGFSIIWFALAGYWMEGVWKRKRVAATG